MSAEALMSLGASDAIFIRAINATCCRGPLHRFVELPPSASVNCPSWQGLQRLAAEQIVQVGLATLCRTHIVLCRCTYCQSWAIYALSSVKLSKLGLLRFAVAHIVLGRCAYCPLSLRILFKFGFLRFVVCQIVKVGLTTICRLS